MQFSTSSSWHCSPEAAHARVACWRAWAEQHMNQPVLVPSQAIEQLVTNELVQGQLTNISAIELGAVVQSTVFVKMLLISCRVETNAQRFFLYCRWTRTS